MAPRPPARDSALRWVLLVILMITPVLVVRALAARSADPREELEPLRQTLHGLRQQLDTCRADASGQEASFRDWASDADSLGARLRELEALHPDGVPVDSYPAYLEVFRAYDDAVLGWESRADSAQDAWEVCRDLTEEHNRLADSLRGRLVDLGLWPGTAQEAP